MRPALLSLALLLPTAAQAFEMVPPLDCSDGSCFIQQYVDRDPGPDARDFTCGPLSYDGHQGTDFALPSLAAMEAGVPVTASAPGTVLGIRDELPDIAANDPNAPDLAGRDCGNGVLIDHGGGWQTQYCHMKRGSIAVEAGRTVTTQTVLGEVGLSGRTVFPHVHVTVRKDGVVVDPFDSAADIGACGGTLRSSLFTETPDYQPGGFIAAGFSDGVPAYDAIKAGGAARSEMGSNESTLVFWAYLFGGRAGDTMRLTITGPGGEVIDHTEALDRTQAQLFRAAGRRTPQGGWPAGSYSGTAILMRGGTEIDRTETAIDLR